MATNSVNRAESSPVTTLLSRVEPELHTASEPSKSPLAARSRNPTANYRVINPARCAKQRLSLFNTSFDNGGVYQNQRTVTIATA